MGSGIVGAIEQKQKQRKYDDKQQQVNMNGKGCGGRL
jgi:hypothetical protein